MAGSAHSKAQRLAKHKKLHPNDLVAQKATGATTQKRAPKSKKWTRSLKTFAEMAVKTGYKGTAVLYEWARGDTYGGQRLYDEKAIAHEKARQQQRAKDQAERQERNAKRKAQEKAAEAKAAAPKRKEK